MNSPIEGKVVLVVDDDKDFLDQHRMLFESFGAKVWVASSRKEAEEIAATAKPDLAVLDLMMDEMDDGFVLSYHLKKKYESLPVIIVTGVTSETGFVFDEPDGFENRWIKADAILPKPIRFEQLNREINRLIQEV